MKNKAVIYARVSTNRQAKEELPIDSQLDSCRGKCKDLGLDIEKEFTDEGLTGSNDRRPGFREAIFYCEQNNINYFITWSSSRFARNKRDASLYKDRLESAGVRVVYVSMDIDLSTTPGWMIDGFMELADEYYSRQTSDDTKRSMIRNAREGFWNGGVSPYGFKPVPSPENPKRKILEPVEEEVEIINYIFNCKAKLGMGARSICRELNNKGISKRGREWKVNTLLDLMKNKALIGKTVFGKRPRGKHRATLPESEWTVVDSHEPIVDFDLFKQVQHMMKDQKNIATAGNQKNLLVGMMHCEECNSPIYVESATGRSRSYHYYFCRDAKFKRNHAHIRHPVNIVNDTFVNAILDQIITEKNISDLLLKLRELKSTWGDSKCRENKILKSEMETLDTKTKKIIDVIEQSGLSASDLPDLLSRVKENNARISAIKDQIRNNNKQPFRLIPTDLNPNDLRDTLFDILTSDDEIESKRHLLQSFISDIQIKEGQLKIDYEPLNIVLSAVRSHHGWLPGPGSNQGPND